MSHSANPIRPEILEEAADWLVEMRESDVPEDRRAAFADWLRASPAHVSAYLEIAKLWGDAAHLGSAVDLDYQEGDAANVIPLRADIAANAPDAQRPAPSRRMRVTAIAASFLVVGIFVTLLAWWQLGRASSIVTAAGEQRVITLDDGSIMRVNSRSKVQVRFTPQLRRVDLGYGQALFEVAKDPARPFVVYSGGVVVRAVGTQFDVYRKQEDTTITVLEGRVALFNPQAPSSSGEAAAYSSDVKDELVVAGEQVVVRHRGAVERHDKPNIAAATGWLKQELIFDGQELSVVVEEFNRYTRVPIVVDDPTLAHVRVNAVFHASDVEPLLRFVSRYEGVRVDRGRSQIRITRDTSVTKEPEAPSSH